MSAAKKVRGLKRVIPTVVIGLAVMALLIAAIVMKPNFVSRIDRGIYDIFLRSMLGGDPSPVPIIVDIDDRSLTALGQWPWPRYVLAELIAQLYEQGARAIGVDILLSEEDRTSISAMKKNFEDWFSMPIEVGGVPDDYMDNDRYFAQILSQVPVVLGMQTVDGTGGASFSSFPITEIREAGARPLADYLPRADDAIVPIKVLGDAARYHGAINAEGDEDGLFRRVPLFLNCGGEPIAGLALATLALAAGDRGSVVHVSVHGPVSVKVAGIDVPVSEAGMMPVAFRGPGHTLPTYSAIDVLSGAIDPELIAGRIAFIGSTAAGLRDLRPTPFDHTYPGLELHAAAVDTILSKRFITEPSWGAGINFMIVIALGSLSMILFGAAPPRAAFACLVAMIVGIWFVCRYMMIEHGSYISPLFGLCSVTIEAFVAFSLRFWIEDKDKRVLRRAFANYVSPEIVGRIVERGGISSLAGETRRISVLFTDLRGFTSMTEKMQPTDVSAMLGAYFSPMTAIVRASGGTLDKFVGDALMAFWNAPLDVADHPRVAVDSLMKMQSALTDINREVEPRFGVTLRMGGGIHTGDAHVGNMGTADLMNYTAIGDTVNTASRLEGMCSKYGLGIVISGDTAEDLRGDGRFVLSVIDLVRVKGRKAGIPIYTVLSPQEASPRASELDAWQRSFEMYIAGDFASALPIFRELAQSRPAEKRYQIFVERAQHMSIERPDEWDGVYTYESK